MEPINQNINLNNNVVTVTQNELPSWFKVILNLYGLGQIFAGIIALIFPLFTGFLVTVMGGGKEGFAGGYKIYAFLAVGALPAFILAYGSLKKRKWIITCLGVSLLFVAFNIFFLKTDALNDSLGSMTPSIISLLNIFPILILILAFVYKESLKGEYFAIIPITLMLIASGYANYLAENTLKTVQEQESSREIAKHNEEYVTGTKGISLSSATYGNYRVLTPFLVTDDQGNKYVYEYINNRYELLKGSPLKFDDFRIKRTDYGYVFIISEHGYVVDAISTNNQSSLKRYLISNNGKNDEFTDIGNTYTPNSEFPKDLYVD
jgi:NADH:ubiquinone oxidoreductase subunit K